MSGLPVAILYKSSIMKETPGHRQQGGCGALPAGILIRGSLPGAVSADFDSRRGERFGTQKNKLVVSYKYVRNFG